MLEVTFIPNTHWPNWRTKPSPTKANSESDKRRFDKEHEFYLEQIKKLQKETPWYANSYAENLSYRKIYDVLCQKLDCINKNSDGTLERTFFSWANSSIPKTIEDAPLNIYVYISSTSWKQDCLGVYRIIYFHWCTEWPNPFSDLPLL